MISTYLPSTIPFPFLAWQNYPRAQLTYISAALVLGNVFKIAVPVINMMWAVASIVIDGGDMKCVGTWHLRVWPGPLVLWSCVKM